MDWQVTIEPLKEKSANPAFDLPDGRTFAPGTDQIVFGRETTCDVVFPPDARIVGGLHGRLYRQQSGDYAIEAFGKHYVAVNGYPLDPGQAISDDAVVRLGGPKGPAFRVRLTRGPRTDGLLSTLTQVSVMPMRKALGRVGRVQWILAGLLLVAIVAGGWAYWSFSTRFAREMTALRTTMAQSVRDSFPPTEALHDAAFAVILVNREGLGKVIATAWPYRAGMLVTNAHVAKVFDHLRPGEKLLVRKPGDSRNHTVIGEATHPGYDEFTSFEDEASQTSKGFKSLAGGAAMPSAYDVAILKVDPAEDLGPFLRVADDPAALKAGAPLAYAGYPLEGTGAQNLAQLAPNPVLQFGRVTALSDYFLLRADAPNSLLVENSLPATGGASGSPIIDSSGQVVAILSGGNVNIVDGGRTPSAVMLNYAQRADLIGGVVDPASFDLAAAKAQWTKVVALFDSHEQTIVAEAQSALEKTTGEPAVELAKISTSLSSSGSVKAGAVRYRDHEVTVQANHTYTFVAYGEYSGTLNLALFRGDNGITGDFGSSWFSRLTYTADRNETLTLRVIGQSNHPVAYDLFTFTGQKALASAPVPSN